MPCRLLKALICCSFIALGCSPSTDKQTSDTSAPAIQEETAPSSPYIPPPQEGVFVKLESETHAPEFLALSEGHSDLLMPTNAERGFGFKVPVGTHLTSDNQKFAIRSGKLNLNMLQMTAFKGIAVPITPWSAAVSDENVAWLPTKVIPTNVKVITEEYGLAEITTEMPLPPGFYVIHDDSMIRAEQAENVSAFYPFVVTEKKDDINVWVTQADTCFAEIFGTFGIDICRNPPREYNKTQIMQCAMQQRIAFKSYDMALTERPQSRAEILAAEKAEKEAAKATKTKKGKKKSKKLPAKPLAPIQLKPAEEYLVRAAYLERLAYPDNLDNHQTILNMINNPKCQTANDLWIIEQHDHLLRLIKLYEMESENDVIPQDLIQAILDYYMPQPPKPADFMEHDPEQNAHDSDQDSHTQAVAKPDDPEKAAMLQEPAAKQSKAPFERPHFTPIEALAWVPFCNLESDDPTLYAFYEAILFSNDWTTRLIELLGAIHYRRLMDTAQKTRRLSEWFKLADADVPEIFRSRAKLMSFRPEQTELAMGPYIFTAIPPNQITPWRATFASQYNAVKTCLEKGQDQPGIFILEQPLNNSIQKQKISGILRDPIDTMRPQPALHPSAADCILRNFNHLPTAPALKPNQHVKIAIAVGPKRAD